MDGGFPFPVLMREPKGKRMSGTTLAVRINPENANHHLHSNHGTWWCHLTLHREDGSKERQRQSLHTSDVTEARDRRDRLLAAYAKYSGSLELTIEVAEHGGFIISRQMAPDHPLLKGGWRIFSARARTVSAEDVP